MIECDRWVRRFRVQYLSVWMLLSCSLAGCDDLTEPRFLPPENSVEQADGTFVTRRDNPVLRGNADVPASLDVGGDTEFVDRRVFGPRVAFLTANGQPIFDRDRDDRGFVWSADSVAVGTIGAAEFVSPSVRLPTDHSAIEFSLSRLAGRRAAPDDPPMNTIGFDEGLIATQSVRLDDHVIVVPVRTVIFSRPGTVSRVQPPEVEQLMDPGASTLLQLTRVDSGTESSVEVRAGRYQDDGATASGARPPDSLWTVCDVQFRSVESVSVEQDQGLEMQLINNSNPCSALFDGPLYAYTQPVALLRAIPVFIGGAIDITLGDRYLGATCPPYASGNPFVAIDARELQTQGVLAHELGHFVGLPHTSSADQLMTPPSADTSSIEGTVVTAEECATARCYAARLLQSFQLADSSLVAAECP